MMNMSQRLVRQPAPGDRSQQGVSSRAPLVALLVLATLASGCGFKIEKVEPPRDTVIEPKGFDSPSAAFEAMKTAAREKDFRKMIACVTDETARTFAGVMMISGAILKAMGSPSLEINKVLSKHGLDAKTLESIPQQLTLTKDPAVVATLADSITDKRRFVAEMLKALDPSGHQAALNDIQGQLSDVTIEGDRAVGIIQRDDKRERLGFRRTSAGWQVHIDVREMPQKQSDGAPKPADDAPASQPSPTSTANPDQ